jgi:hypothetical protein
MISIKKDYIYLDFLDYFAHVFLFSVVNDSIVGYSLHGKENPTKLFSYYALLSGYPMKTQIKVGNSLCPD